MFSVSLFCYIARNFYGTTRQVYSHSSNGGLVMVTAGELSRAIIEACFMGNPRGLSPDQVSVLIAEHLVIFEQEGSHA